MRIEFTVHGVRKGHVAVDATINDVRQRALVDGMEVELTTNTGRSLTLSIHGSDMGEAERVFQPGEKVWLTVEGTEGQPNA